MRARSALLLVAGLLAVSPQEAQAEFFEGLSAVRCKLEPNDRTTDPEKLVIFRLHKNFAEYRYFDENCNGVIDPDEQTKLNEHKQTEVKKVADAARGNMSLYAADGVAAPVPPEKPSAPKKVHGYLGPTPVLRDDFADVSIFSQPKSVKDAQGSTFSFARNGEADNTAWTAKGLAALPFVWREKERKQGEPLPSPHVVGFAVTPSLSFHRVSNSNEKSKGKDVDILSPAVGGEIGLTNLFGGVATHYFRLRGGLVSNFDADMRSWNVVGEYQPFTNKEDSLRIGTPNPFSADLPWTYTLDLIVRAQYASKIDDDIDDPLFDKGKRVFRAGPVLALGVHVPSDADAAGEWPWWVSRISLAGSFSYLEALNHSKSYLHFSGSLGFALDEDGLVGLKLTHERGRLEDTGEKVSITSLALTAKY